MARWCRRGRGRYHTDRQSGAALQNTRHMPRRAAARIRAMITLWQQGGKRRAEVGKRARIYADAQMCI
jgi:hypothetical protein